MPEVEVLQTELEQLREENRLLRQKIGWLIKRYFGGNQSERIDPGQLELLLAGLEQAEENKPAEQTAEPPPEPKARKGAGARRQRLPEHLEVEEIVIEPEAVKVEPQKWRLIGEEVTEELDLLPARFIRRRYIRRKYVSREKPQEPPVLAPLPSRLIEKGIPGVGLLVHILLSKYVDHLPLYRQEKIFRERYGVRVARQSMLDWIHQVAQWLKPIYNYMCLQLFEGGYIQADETPIRYLDPDAGKKEGCRKGYLGVYGRPGGEVLYDWHTGRGVKCLEQFLNGYEGLLQTDGYALREAYRKSHGRMIVERLGSWNAWAKPCLYSNGGPCRGAKWVKPLSML